MTLYTYKAKVIRVVDGDTFESLIDLGFDTWVSITVRLTGINTPESRTRDLNEKKKGIAAKDRLTQLLSENGNEITLISHGVEKYGRCLAEVFVKNQTDSVQKILIKEGFGVEYHGGKR
jgi:micrococcal nuclease